MSIAKKISKRTNTEPLRKKSQNKYVVDESEIGDFIGNLSICQIDETAASLQAFADLTGLLLNNTDDEVRQCELEKIKRLASTSNNKQYRQMMKAMMGAIRQGPGGIKAGHQTATRAVELAFRWTAEYFVAFDLYREKLRRMIEEGEGNQSTLTL